MNGECVEMDETYKYLRLQFYHKLGGDNDPKQIILVGKHWASLSLWRFGLVTELISCTMPSQAESSSQLATALCFQIWSWKANGRQWMRSYFPTVESQIFLRPDSVISSSGEPWPTQPFTRSEDNCPCRRTVRWTAGHLHSLEYFP